jgi:hypothetical protein
MNLMKRSIFLALGASLLGFGSVAVAASWTNASCGSSSCTTTTQDGISATVKAFSAQVMTSTASSNPGAYVTTNNFNTASALTYNSGYGYQVQGNGSDTNTPNHSIDNFGNLDLVLIQFSQAVTLQELKLGWSQYDSDVTIMAYKGDTSDASTAAGTITTKNVGNLAAVGGWELVANAADVGSTSTTANTSNTQVATFNSGGLHSSSWWLVSAFNSTLGGVASVNGTTGLTMGNITSTSGSGSSKTYNNNSSNWDNGYDFIKLASVGGFKTPPKEEVPEPGSLALAGLALFGMIQVRRNRRAQA